MDKVIKIGKDVIPYILVILLALFIRGFIFEPVRVKGPSMNDTLKNGQLLILNKTSKNYKRFDIVVIKSNGTRIIKRIIGLPGEKIEYKDNSLYINNEYVKDVTTEVTEDFSLEELYGYEFLPQDYYFVMGDNRDDSTDSRKKVVGLINKKDILGKVKLRFWPLNKIGRIK